LVEALQKTLATPEMNTAFSAAEVINLSKLSFALNGENVRMAALHNILFDLRLAAIKARTGTAVMLNKRRSLTEQDMKTLSEIVALLDEDDFLLLENNRIAGVVSLYGMPGSLEMLAQSAGDLAKLDQQPNEPGGSRLVIASAFLGTLQLRGNQLVRLAVGHTMLDELRQRAGGEGNASLASDAFARLLLDGNVIEGVLNLTLARHLNVRANEFTQTAAPAGRSRLAAGTARTLGWFVADSATYIGNQGTSAASILVDLSQVSERVANVQMTVS
jgi:hypothetical protein